MFRIAICDDDISFLEYERKCIDEYMLSLGVRYEVEAFSDGNKLIAAACEDPSYNLIILDVEMPQVDGMSLARTLRDRCPNAAIAFVSAYIDYSLDGYKVNAVRYILKSKSHFPGYIAECIDHVIETSNKDSLSVEYDFTIGKRKLAVKDILYIESRKNYTVFVTVKDTVEVLCIKKPLKTVSEQLAAFDFICLNPKQTANMAHIKSIGRYEVLLDNGQKLPVSQRKYNDVYKDIALYRGKSI